MSSYFRQQLESYLKTIDVRADRVLDVGGGALPVKDRVRSWNVGEYKILDNQLEEIKQAPDIVADINNRYLTATDEGNENFKQYTGNPFGSGYFDVIFCLEVFEYVWNPIDALENMNCVLKKGGILYISFPFIYPHHNPAGHDFLRYTRWGVMKLLKETGFEIEEIKARTQKVEIDYNNNNGPQPKQQDIKGWFADQKMHPVKGGSVNHNEIGYLVKARKK